MSNQKGYMMSENRWANATSPQDPPFSEYAPKIARTVISPHRKPHPLSHSHLPHIETSRSNTDPGQSRCGAFVPLLSRQMSLPPDPPREIPSFNLTAPMPVDTFGPSISKIGIRNVAFADSDSDSSEDDYDGDGDDEVASPTSAACNGSDDDSCSSILSPITPVFLLPSISHGEPFTAEGILAESGDILSGAIIPKMQSYDPESSTPISLPPHQVKAIQMQSIDFWCRAEYFAKRVCDTDDGDADDENVTVGFEVIRGGGLRRTDTGRGIPVFVNGDRHVECLERIQHVFHTESGHCATRGISESDPWSSSRMHSAAPSDSSYMYSSQDLLQEEGRHSWSGIPSPKATERYPFPRSYFDRSLPLLPKSSSTPNLQSESDMCIDSHSSPSVGSFHRFFRSGRSNFHWMRASETRTRSISGSTGVSESSDA